MLSAALPQKGATMNLFPVNTEYTKLQPLVRVIGGIMKNLHHWCEKLSLTKLQPLVAEISKFVKREEIQQKKRKIYKDLSCSHSSLSPRYDFLGRNAGHPSINCNNEGFQ